MKSIRKRLILSLLLGLALLFTAASTVLYLYARGALIRQFDDSLKAKMISFAGMSEVEEKNGIGIVELEFVDFPLPEFQTSSDAEYYQVWQQNGTVYARSASLEGKDLPRLEDGPDGLGIRDIPLPDGREGRAAAIRFTPTPEPGKEPSDYYTEKAAYRFLLVMARSREELDHTLKTLLAGHIVTGLVLIFGILLFVRWTVVRGLLPLERIARETTHIQANNLTHRFATQGMPEELVPICNGLNELLGRIESAFLRERRFNADVAHELRTPVAELRTLAEVALKREPDAASLDFSQSRFQDVLEIAEQMEKLITTLLALVRCEAQRQTMEKESVDLIGLIEHGCTTYKEEAKQREITFSVSLPEEARIQTDKTLLSAVMDNLFSNAVAHTPDGGSIGCEVQAHDNGFLFRLKNTNDHLVPEDLDHLFEPFWKKDPARTDSISNGLGLSLVSAYADLLGLELKADLIGREWVEISFKIR